jgi:hypothetical protein
MADGGRYIVEERERERERERIEFGSLIMASRNMTSGILRSVA